MKTIAIIEYDEEKKEFRIRKLPEKKHPDGSDVFNDYVHGYNDCIDDIRGDR